MGLKELKKIESRLDLRSVIGTIAFDVIVAIIVFIVAFVSTHDPISTVYYTLMAWFFTAIITMGFWIRWIFKRKVKAIREYRIAATIVVVILTALVLMLTLYFISRILCIG